MFFKPAWQSKKSEKAEVGIKKLKKQDEIYEACIHFNKDFSYLFPRVYFKLTNSDLKREAARLFLQWRFQYPDWLLRNRGVVYEILEDLRKSEVLVPVLAELRESEYKDTLLFINLLRNELRINKLEFQYLADKAKNPILKALAIVSVFGDDVPESVFEESEELLKVLMKFCSSQWATKHYEKFPENVQYTLLSEGLLDNEAIVFHTSKKNIPAMFRISLSQLREIVKQMDKTECMELLEWYIKKVPQNTWMKMSVFDLENLCLELLADKPGPEEIVCYYDGLLKRESKELYFKKMMAARSEISKAGDENYYSRLMDEMEQDEDLLNRRSSVLSLSLEFSRKRKSEASSSFKRLSRIFEKLCTALMDAMEQEKDLEKLGKNISTLFWDFKDFRISEDSSFHSRLIEIAENRESMVLDGLEQEKDLDKLDKNICTLFEEFKKFRISEDSSCHSRLIEIAESRESMVLDGLEQEKGLIKRKEGIVQLFQDFKNHRIAKKSPLKKRLEGIINKHDEEVVALLKPSVLSFQEMLDKADLIVGGDIRDREITLIHRDQILNDDVQVVDKLNLIKLIGINNILKNKDLIKIVKQFYKTYNFHSIMEKLYFIDLLSDIEKKEIFSKDFEFTDFEEILALYKVDGIEHITERMEGIVIKSIKSRPSRLDNPVVVSFFKDLDWYFHQKTETTPAQCECGNGWEVVGAGVSEKCTNCDGRGNLNYSIEKVISQFLMKDGHEIINF